MLLLDTHVVLWSLLSPDHLGPNARRLLESEECFVSTISAHEVSRLVSLGRIVFAGSLDEWFSQAQTALGFMWIELSVSQAIESYQLKNFEHKDPCDRIIAACARQMNAPVLTADRTLLDYAPLRTVDARR
ncbi:MAG: type II toxin-antitoxin system VapC family toxin [Myxococcaceae bacterium]